MKLNLDQEIKNFSGQPIFNNLTDKVPITYRVVIENVLNMFSTDYPLTAEKKLFAFQIGVRLFSQDLPEYDLTVDQIAFLKERIGLFYSPAVYGRFLELIGDQSIIK
jgi:hypothetical protein